ncbi:MAG: hypothetical protein WA802_01250 [Terracidiphilus sp.]
MRMRRRSFIKASLATSAALAVPNLLTDLAATAEGVSPALPWQREMPLREAAQAVFIENILDRKNPLPDADFFGNSESTTINNLKMRTTMWGPPDRITISLNKNNVWDRRVNIRSLRSPTLQDVIDGACSPANRDYVGREKDSQRPASYGYLLKQGGSYDGYRDPMEYAFPCMKPVGQIILGMDRLAEAAAPKAAQSCANGVVKLQVAKDSARAGLEYVLGMTNNIYAIRGNFSGIDVPIWLRLYRHRDTSHLSYMSENGTYTRPGTEYDRDFNFPMDPPTSGQDGKYFWIRQKFPEEKTFPQGFESVLMGVVTSSGKAQLDNVEGKTGIGTPPPDRLIAAAAGAAATATFTPGANGRLEAFVAVVTTMDGPDVMAEAKKRLAKAEAAGFNAMVHENTQWWNAFYEKRENGRVFYGAAGRDCSDDIRIIYRSYTESHGGGTKTDMRQFECSASYALPERDTQLWTSAPCYNEVFTTSRFVRNWGDSEDMWKQLVWHWMPGGKQNAADMFNMHGMLVVHGYLPPVKSDIYVHTTMTLEFCMGTMAEIIKPVWDEWDYGGDINVLRKECYPLMREMALFYAAYVKKGDDGCYHAIPTMEEERWGWYPNLSHNQDVTSSLCMIRWGLMKTAEAAELLDVDADLRSHWRQVGEQIVPYATWKTPEGLEYAGQPGLEPARLAGDHFGEPSMYPALLADEINLDSPKEQREMMLRTVHSLSTAGTAAETALLLGVRKDPAISGFRLTGREDDAEAMLNSRGGRIHLFPVTPAADVVAFRNFQARGGFLVSACKNADGVYYLEIESRRDHPCKLMNPWPGKRVAVREKGSTQRVPAQLDTSNGECLIFSSMAGGKYLIAPMA